MRVLPAAPAEMPVTYGVEGTELSYGAPGAVTLTTVYDERERPAEATFRGVDQGVVRRIVFSKDHEGRVVSEAVHFGGETPFPLNALSAPEGVQAAESGQLAALMRAVFADQTFSNTTYAYDEKGRLRERTMRMGTLSEDTTVYEYDDHDNPVIETSNSHRHDMGTVMARSRPSSPELHPLLPHEQRVPALQSGSPVARIVASDCAAADPVRFEYCPLSFPRLE